MSTRTRRRCSKRFDTCGQWSRPWARGGHFDNDRGCPHHSRRVRSRKITERAERAPRKGWTRRKMTHCPGAPTNSLGTVTSDFGICNVCAAKVWSTAAPNIAREPTASTDGKVRGPRRSAGTRSVRRRYRRHAPPCGTRTSKGARAGSLVNRSARSRVTRRLPITPALVAPSRGCRLALRGVVAPPGRAPHHLRHDGCPMHAQEG